MVIRVAYYLFCLDNSISQAWVQRKQWFAKLVAIHCRSGDMRSLSEQLQRPDKALPKA